MKTKKANLVHQEYGQPEDVAVDSKTGNVYITDTGNSRVQVFNTNN
jgi:DNA-binding beta-propeller fold protein YncE